MFHNLAEEHLKHHKFTHFWKHLWRPVDNISQSLSPCCSSCATGLLQNKDQNNLAVKGFFPAPSGSGPTKTPLKFQSLQFFFWSNSIRTYSGCCFFFFRHFLSFMFVRAHHSNKPTAPKSRVFGFTILFSASTNWLQMKVWSKKYSKSATCPSIQHWQHLWTLKV